MKLFFRILCLLFFLSISFSGYLMAEDKSSDTLDLDFEIPEVETKPYSFNAKFEISETIKGLDEDSLLFHQRYPNGRDDETLYQTEFDLKVEGSYQVSIVKLYARLNGDLYYNKDEDWVRKKLMYLCYHLHL